MHPFVPLLTLLSFFNPPLSFHSLSPTPTLYFSPFPLSLSPTLPASFATFVPNLFFGREWGTSPDVFFYMP